MGVFGCFLRFKRIKIATNCKIEFYEFLLNPKKRLNAAKTELLRRAAVGGGGGEPVDLRGKGG